MLDIERRTARQRYLIVQSSPFNLFSFSLTIKLSGHFVEAELQQNVIIIGSMPALVQQEHGFITFILFFIPIHN